MARTSKYDEVIKPYLKDIKKAVESGATVEEIATAYGIATSTLYEYKAKHPELAEAFAHGREKVIIEIKAALLKKALGYEYEEKKQYIKKDKDGEKVQYTELNTRHQPPSETAAAMLLRNYDAAWRDSDNTSAEMKRQEMELRRAIAESQNFDLDLDDDGKK